MSGNSWRKTALVMSVLAVCGMCGCENRSSGDEDRTEYIYGDSIEEDHGAYDNIVQLVYINAVDGSCVDIIETAKCLETWYGTDPETGAGTKTISNKICADMVR